MESKIDSNITNDMLQQFERNNYFYGKLMTVSDFEDEQKYHDGKRHLINKLISGEGIVCGLYVSAYNKESLSAVLSSGIAFDCMGREIIVSKNNEEHKISVHKLNPKLHVDISHQSIGLYIRRRDDEKEMVPALSQSQDQKCTANKIQENYELFFDVLYDDMMILDSSLSDKTSTEQRDILSRECPSCKGKDSSVLLAVLKKSSAGWILDDLQTSQLRRIVRTWFNHTDTDDSVGKTNEVKSTTGLVEFDSKKGTNILYGPVEHYLRNMTSPPVIILAKTSDPFNVEYMEDYGLAEGSTPEISFKAVNINLKSFMVRIDSNRDETEHIMLRWWANASSDTGTQEIKPIQKPTIQLNQAKYSIYDKATITITDPNIDKNQDSIQFKVSTNTKEKILHAGKIGSGGGVFNTQFSIDDLAENDGKDLIVTYEFKIRDNKKDTINATAKIVKFTKPTIKFISDLYAISDPSDQAALVYIVDKSKENVDYVQVEVNSEKGSSFPKTYPAKRKKPVSSGQFVASIPINEIIVEVPDTLIASYKFQLGTNTETISARTKVTKT